jgi:acyl-CoA thioester hydrolase
MARFVAHCAMRWSDMDAYGHINNTAYLSYLEQARVTMFFDRYDSSFAGGTVVSHHEITYLRPVIYHPVPLQVEMWADELKAASFRVGYEVFDGDVLAARAATRLVTFDFATDRPRRLTDEERDIVLSYADEGPHPRQSGKGPALISADAPPPNGFAPAGPAPLDETLDGERPPR